MVLTMCDEIRWQARDLLDQLNISERVIYPGLDGLSKWLEASNGYTRPHCLRSSSHI